MTTKNIRAEKTHPLNLPVSPVTKNSKFDFYVGYFRGQSLVNSILHVQKFIWPPIRPQYRVVFVMLKTESRGLSIYEKTEY